MRTLVSVQKIVSTAPIEGADRIEIANVLGWQCVTQKSNGFKPGDLIAYFEIDSLIPLDIPQFSFLRKKDTETHARIKTIKLKGKFAQGLILPLSEIEAILKVKEPDKVLTFAEGDDLTELLGVTKWEPEIPAQLAGKVVSSFPSFVSKTDETRIQSCPGVLDTYKDEKVFITEKLDGSSITIFYVNRNQPGLPTKYLEDNQDEMIFGVCSRNLCIARSADNSFWKAVEILDIENKLKALGKPIVLQGELIGLGVCGNKLGLTSLDIKLFNIADPTTRTYYNFEDFIATAKALQLGTVPILDEHIGVNLGTYNVEQFVNLSMAYSKLNPKVWREGIVVRPLVEKEVRGLGRLSFKVINPQFLVKYDT